MTLLSLTHNSFRPERLCSQAFCIAQPIKLHLVAPVSGPKLNVQVQPEFFVKASIVIYKLDINHSTIILLHQP